MKKYLPVLRQCPLFDGIEDKDIPGMLDCLGAAIRAVNKNGEILAERERATHVGILLSGSAHVVQQDFYGNRSIVSSLKAGELFAESFACAGEQILPVSVVAVEPCQVMFVHCQRITVGCSNACCFHSRLIYNLLKIVARRNLEFHQKLEVIGNRTTREKLMAYLLLQAKQAGGDSFTIPYDRQGLADYLGVERSALSAEISKLRRSGVLTSKKSQFKLL